MDKLFGIHLEPKKYFKKKQEKLGYLPVGSLTDGHEFSPTISPNISVISRSEVQSQSQSNNTVFPKTQDEHNLIAEYCQMLNERKNDDDVELNIKELESERKALLAEYQDLSQQVQNKGLSKVGEPILNPNVVEDQTKQLRHETTRMEIRMKMLMEHNSSLELQLQRLRQLALEGQDESSAGGGQFGTLRSKSLIAKDLNVQSPKEELKTKQDVRRLPPALDSSREYLNGQTDDDDDFNDNKASSQSSLDLSAHETQTHEESD